MGLGGLAFLVLMTVLLGSLKAPSTWGFFILAFYWLVLCIGIGAILLLGRLFRRFARRFAHPS
jgi:Kef-type K+ transport system membrane component KefB